MSHPEYQDVLNYIEAYWQKANFAPGQKIRGGALNSLMRVGYIQLPNDGMSPNDLYFAGMQFYWDSYFTILGLIDTGHGDLARAVVDDLCYLYDTMGLIPARNARSSMGRTQPPYLTRMAWEVYEEAGAADDRWMSHVMTVAQNEYERVWNAGQRAVPELGLNRYRPRFFARQLTVYESGWDQSTRFAHKGKNLVPVDLNAQLYQYEADLHNWTQLHAPDAAAFWLERMNQRREAITKYLWDEETGFFYDYNLAAKRKEWFKTLAGFFPLWCGAATQEQAARCREHLKAFEYDFGLATTEPVAWKGRQWDYPNGWAPLHYIVIMGLRRYGFHEDAYRLTRKWLNLCEELFKTTGQLWEKYDVVHGSVGLSGRYPTQPGFSWTNGVFIRLLAEIQNEHS